MRPASRKIGDHSAHAVSLEESTRTSSRVKKSSCGVADHLEFTEDPELPARGVLRGDLSAKQNFFCRLCGNHAPREISTPVPTLPQTIRAECPDREAIRPASNVWGNSQEE